MILGGGKSCAAALFEFRVIEKGSAQSTENTVLDTKHLQETARQLQLALPAPSAAEEAVIFIHGWSCRASDWLETLEALEGRYPALVPDLPGHGDSHSVPWQSWRIEALGQLICALAEQQGVRRLRLVGHSMGGAVALEAARHWVQSRGSDTLAGVILVDTFGLAYGDMDAETITAIETPFREDFPAAMRQLVQGTTAPGLPEQTRSWIGDRMASADPEKMLPLWSSLLRWSPDAAFETISSPIIALNGENIPEPAQRRCEPHVAEKVLPGAGHFPQFEVPSIFVEALTEALDSLR